MVASGTGSIEQINHYYPYGGMIGDLSTNQWKHPYKYNGKEYETMYGLNTYDYGARQYDPARITWDRMDQLCEKYYNINPYVYCGGNPINRIDPDGRIIKIWYKDSHNRDKCYTFTGFHGKTKIDIPNNKFVKDVVESYVYNCKNGGGDMMKKAVYSKNVIYVDDARFYDGKDEFQNSGNQPTVYWNPDMGLKTTEEGLQSPATALEHEMDHAVDYVENTHEHNERSYQSDAQYDTNEERRVITGSEAKTAKANGEAVRKNHKGTPYRTISPTSTKKQRKI